MSAIATRVLWLEDDHILGPLLAGLLPHPEFIVRMVPSAQALFDGLSDAWDVVVLDLQLGNDGWAGLEVLETIRNSNPIVPIVVCTGRALRAEVRRALRLGADEVVFKEEADEHLAATVQRLTKAEVRFPNVVEQLPMPLAFLGRRLLAAESPLERVRLAFDILETSVKLLAVSCVRDLVHSGGLHELVRAHVSERVLAAPSFGDWCRLLDLSLGSDRPSPKADLAHKSARSLRADRLLSRVTESVKARNDLFGHGVTPSDAVCLDAFTRWWSLVFQFLVRCSLFTKHQLVLIDRLTSADGRLTASGFVLQGSSLLVSRRSIVVRASTIPTTGVVYVLGRSGEFLLNLHPWILVRDALPLGKVVCVYDKVVGRHRDPTSGVDYLDLVTGEKSRFEMRDQLQASLGL